MKMSNPIKAVGNKWTSMSKWKKVVVVAGAGGVVVVLAPFAVAAASGCSIVSALATIGGGAVAAGGLGVKGGIVLVAGGAAAAAAGGGAVASKFASDPELVALKDNFAKMEKRVATLTVAVERILKDNTESKVRQDEINQRWSLACKRYAKLADEANDFKIRLTKSGKYKGAEVRRMLAEIQLVGELLDNVNV